MDSSSSTMEETISTDSPPPAPPLKRVGSGDGAVIDPPDSTSSSSTTQPFARKLPSSQFKGVVPQPNGRWGAQIYEKHRRVWLGTFASEPDAARAYDAAVLRFRGRDAATNFPPPSDPSDPELLFLASRSKAEVVDMLRKHTYAHELAAFPPNHSPLADRPAREPLFDKAVTPSDVGKLNRLVIPKQHAERHFPANTSTSLDSGSGGVLLNFEDGGGKVWRFRYSYWNSSQSYVLTRGWSRFVKDKGLRAGDLVRFQRSTGPDRQLYIDFTARPAGPAVRLFGVDILEVPGRKRWREAELGMKPGQMLKRQCSSVY